MTKVNPKQKEYLFVDGYNIINSWTSLAEARKISLEEARGQLLEILAEYHHYSHIDIVVVFDAYDVKGNMGNEVDHKGIKVIFTKEGETADHFIEKTLDKIGRIRNIRVATSDRLEQEMILARGGRRVSARELQAEIFDEMRMAKRKSKDINKENDKYLGRLDKDTLKKLDNWNKLDDFS